MKLKSLEVKQKKIIRFVKSYFTKDNSPFIKKNYFALYEDGDGMREIQKNIFNLKKNDKKYSLIKIINFIKNFNYDVSSIKNNKRKYYKNLVITWGNESNFYRGSFVDKYFDLDIKNFKDTFWIILSPKKFVKRNINDNLAIVYPQNKLSNYINFTFHFLTGFIFRNQKKLIDQDQVIAESINNFILKNKNFSKVENLLMPYEGQAFQKKIFYEQKKANKTLKTFGFDHTAPHSLPTQLYYTKGSPDNLFVSGANTKKTYTKFYGWPINKINTTFPCRYKSFNKKNFINILFLPYDFRLGKIITNSLNSFLNRASDKSLNKFIVKIHPVKSTDLKHILLKKELDNVIKQHKKKFTDKSNYKLSIVVGFTSAAIVALEYGLSVLHICPDPIFDKYSNYFWKDIDIKRIDNYSFLYKLKKKGKYLDFKSNDKIKTILKNEGNRS
jgi:hypothetical protein